MTCYLALVISALNSLWVPADEPQAVPVESRAITSARLDEGATVDRIALYVLGELVAEFDVPSGIGPRVLSDMGLRRVQP